MGCCKESKSRREDVCRGIERVRAQSVGAAGLEGRVEEQFGQAVGLQKDQSADSNARETADREPSEDVQGVWTRPEFLKSSRDRVKETESGKILGMRSAGLRQLAG